MNQKLKGFNNCKTCGQRYEMGFYGAGPKYCSHKCNRKGRAIEDKLRHGKRYVRKDKDCLICGRSILKVGLRKCSNKFCSKKCMMLSNKIKHSGQKTVMIRIPVKVEVMKTVKIPVKDIPLFFGQIK